MIINVKQKLLNVEDLRGQCYRCGGSHMARYCKETSGIICYRYRQPGHISSQCHQGNDRGSVAPAVTPRTNNGTRDEITYHFSND